MGLKYINKYTATGSESTIEFTSIPQTYKHLIVKCSVRTNGTSATNWQNLNVTFNNDTGSSNYTSQLLHRTESQNVPAMANDGGNTFFRYLYFVEDGSGGTTAPANMFSCTEFFVPNYSNTSISNRTIGTETTIPASSVSYITGASSQKFATAGAISSLQIKIESGNGTAWKANSTVTLYGMD